MKKILLMLCVFIAYMNNAVAQNRKHTSSFPLFQHYYNPAFTGYQGSAVKSYYRNQWAGFDGAPKTLFVSGEINLGDYRQALSSGEEETLPVAPGIQHSFGLSVLHDTYGPFVESQVYAGYRSGIYLTEKINLQAGAAIAYHGQYLDGNKLTTEETGDPSLQNFVNQTNRSGKIDVNIGLALSGSDFYAGYSIHNISKGNIARGEQDFFRNNSRMHHIVLGGYRRAVSDKVGVVFNGMFRYDAQLDDTFEGQVKGVFYNTAWMGFGYRSSLAYSMCIGFRMMNQLKVGYVFEKPTGDAQMTGASTNEIMLTYDLKKIVHPKLTRQMTIW